MSEFTPTSLTKRIRAVLDAPSDRLDVLVRTSGINPHSDLRFGDWRGLDLSGADLRQFDFTGADLSDAKFDGARVAGAIFDGAKYDLASLYKAEGLICFTSHGRLVALQPGATAADFAKAILPEGLSRVSSVKINDEISPLKSALKNSDRIEIVVPKRLTRTELEIMRNDFVKSLARREGVEFKNIRKALYRSDSDGVSAVCSLSRRYQKKRPQYWYGYTRQWHDFLSQDSRSYLILGCTDRDIAYAIPKADIAEILDQLYRTSDRHWHIVLEESKNNEFNLVTAKGDRVPVDRYELNYDVRLDAALSG